MASSLADTTHFPYRFDVLSTKSGASEPSSPVSESTTFAGTNRFRPGDTLSVETTILETQPSEGDPTTGIVRERISVTNQSGTEVLSLKNRELVERRDTENQGDGR